MVQVRRQRRLRSMSLCWGLSLSKLPKGDDGTMELPLPAGDGAGMQVTIRLGQAFMWMCMFYDRFQKAESILVRVLRGLPSAGRLWQPGDHLGCRCNSSHERQ